MIFLDFHIFSGTFHEFLRISKLFNIFDDLNGFSRISMVFIGFSRFVWDFQGFSMIFKEF